MNLDSLFTVAALLVAVYAIMPQHEQLKLKMRFNVTAWLILIIPCVIILYMQFYPTFKSWNLTPNWGLHRWGITPYNASFLVLTVALLLLYFYFKKRDLSVSDIQEFHAYFLRLKNEKKYNELFSFIEGNLNFLERVRLREFWQVRLRQRIEKKIYTDISDFKGSSDLDLQRKLHEISDLDLQRILGHSSKISLCDKILNAICKRLLWVWRQDYLQEISLAEDIYRIIRTDGEIIAAMCATRLDIVMSILRMDVRSNMEYAGFCLRYMIKDNRSPLFYEIQNRYEYFDRDDAPKHGILKFLFDDCNVAYESEVWRPVGEFVISELENLRLTPEADEYNRPEADDNQKNFTVQLPFFAAVVFFDIMVTSALKQNIKHHMWVVYFDYFTRRILKNLKPNRDIINMNDEFPTRYHQLLYEMVSLLCGWSISVIPSWKLSKTQEIPVLDDTDPTSSSKESIKLIMTILASVNEQIIMSEKVGYKFQNYILGMVYDRYFQLTRAKGVEKYAEALRNAIRCGGAPFANTEYDVKRTPHRYKQSLLDGLNNRDVVDYPVHRPEDIKELREILQKDLDSSETES